MKNLKQLKKEYKDGLIDNDELFYTGLEFKDEILNYISRINNIDELLRIKIATNHRLIPLWREIKQKIINNAKDHYWGSLYQNKNLILEHIEKILNLSFGDKNE